MGKKDNEIWEQIGKDISDGVKDVMKAIEKIDMKEYQKKMESWPKKERSKSDGSNEWVEYESTNRSRTPALRVDKQGNPIAPFRGKSIFYQIVGYFTGIPLVLTSIIQTGSLIKAFFSASGTGFVFSQLLLLLLLIYPSTYIALRIGWKGFRLARARERLGSYWVALKEKGFAAINQLAQTVERPMGKVREEIKFMVKEGFFDYGKYDKTTDTLIINEPNYLAHQKASELEYQKQKELVTPVVKEEVIETVEAEPVDMLEEGRGYIEQLRFAREGIRSEEMQNDLIHLENITENIFEFVTKNPDKLSKIRRFMQYYLPTTVKFAKAYDVMEDQAVQGTNIVATKTRIEDSMKLITQAFERLLDELFQKEALDIESDLIAMETMMARDGLGGKDFIRGRQEEERTNDGQ